MKIDVFYVTYRKDLRWFLASLASVKKNLRGYEDIVAVAPEEDRELFERIPGVKWNFVPDWPGQGYLWQQWVKMRAPSFTGAEYLVFMDSDVLVARPTDVSSAFKRGKTAWFFRDYSNAGQAAAWKPVTEAAALSQVDREYMNAFPFVVSKSTCVEAEKYMTEKHRVSLEQYLRGRPTFSEFNFMGWFAETNQDAYRFIEVDSEAWDRERPFYSAFTQHWSHADFEAVLPEIAKAVHPICTLTDRKQIGPVLNACGLTGFGLEVGVAYGENAEAVLEKWSGSVLLLVDPWNREACGEYVDGSSQIDFDGAYLHMLDRLKRFVGRTGILRMTSDQAIQKIPHGFLDFAYIDGNHHNPQFARDLAGWFDKVKPGGVFGGHDYYDLDEPHYRCDVRSTVDAFVKEKGLELHVSDWEKLDFSWWIVKP